MLAAIHSAAVLGIDAYDVTVEVDVVQGLPQWTIVGTKPLYALGLERDAEIPSCRLGERVIPATAEIRTGADGDSAVTAGKGMDDKSCDAASEDMTEGFDRPREPTAPRSRGRSCLGDPS